MKSESTMNAERIFRKSDSPFVQQITRVQYHAATIDVTKPDGCWDMVVLRRQGEVIVLQTGLITRPVVLKFGPGDEYLCVSLRPGVYMPGLPGSQMLDKGIERPVASRTKFWLGNDRFEIPNFENAEGMVRRLAKAGRLAQDEIVHSLVQERPKAASLRTVQRRFINATGVTWKHLEMIFRAGQAVDMLRRGAPALEVTARLGYADQAHLIRSLRGFMGQTPGEISRATEA